MCSIFFLLTAFSCSPKISEGILKNLPEGFKVNGTTIEEDFFCEECQLIESRFFEVLNKKDLKTISPEDYRNWEDCIAQNPSIKLFKLVPGDYRKWGVLNLKQQSGIIFSGEKQLKKNGTHPFNLNPNEEVIVEGFELFDCEEIVLNGLSINGRSKKTKYHNKLAGKQNLIVGGRRNMIRSCYVQDVYQGSGIRIRNSNENVIIGCLMRQSAPSLTGDNVAILIQAHSDKKSFGNLILNNEIVNWNDGFLLSYNIPKRKGRLGFTGECPRTIFSYNNVYITKEFYESEDSNTKAFAENAIDLKVGTHSTEENDRIIISYNKIWGYRLSNTTYSSGSAGEAISIHVDASNIFIKNNIIYDVPLGISIRHNSNKYPNSKVENICVENNLFYQVKNFSNYKDGGIGVLTNTNGVIVRNNTFVDVTKAIDERKKNRISFYENTETQINEKKQFRYSFSRKKWNTEESFKNVNLLIK